MTAAEINHGAGAGEWMLEAFTRIKSLHERMDQTSSEAEQQRLSDESAALAQPWESSRVYAPQWRALWDRDHENPRSIESVDVGLVSQRDRLAVTVAELTDERDQLRAENAELIADRAELAGQLTQVMNERDRLRHLVHELETEVDDALDIAGPHVLDAGNERLAVPMTPVLIASCERPRVVMQQ